MRNGVPISPAGIAVVGLVAGSVLPAGCEQRMTDQPKLETYESMAEHGWEDLTRQPVEGTVPWRPPGGGDAGPGRSITVTLELLRRGRERYDIFCAPCHGLAGQGDGIVVEHGFPPPPSFHSARLRQVPPTFYYTVITQGIGKMASYAGRVPPDDRWAIAAYIQALQLSQNASPDMLPERLRNAQARAP